MRHNLATGSGAAAIAFAIATAGAALTEFTERTIELIHPW